MTQKIEPWLNFEHILARFEGLGGMFATLSTGMSGGEKVAFVDRLLRLSVVNRNDEQAMVMIELMKRAQEELQPLGHKWKVEFRRYLEELFWMMPIDTGKCTLLESKKYIVRELITEWVATESPESVYAFRRLIAMGWPMAKDYSQRSGEHDVEMKARGRCVTGNQLKDILDIVRGHLEYFGFHERGKSPDTVFGPWLAQTNVPADLRIKMAMARTKLGGPLLAERDMRNGAILDGLPGTGLDIIKNLADPMRQIIKDVNEMLERLLVYLGKIASRFHAQKHLPRKMHFEATDSVVIEIGPTGRSEEVFLEALAIVTVLRQEGRLQNTQVTLVVTPESQVSEGQESGHLKKVWCKVKV